MSTAVATETRLAAPARAERAADAAFAAAYAEGLELVWCALRRLGVPVAQLDDATHDVFLVVQRRLPEFEGRSALKTWLYAIALRVARHYRAQAGRHPEEPLGDEMPDHGAPDPHGAAERAEAMRTLYSVLERLDDDQRAVFVMVELEELPVPEVARIVGAPLNTTYSRLRLGRQAFERALARLHAADRRAG